MGQLCSKPTPPQLSTGSQGAGVYNNVALPDWGVGGGGRERCLLGQQKAAPQIIHLEICLQSRKRANLVPSCLKSKHNTRLCCHLWMPDTPLITPCPIPSPPAPNLLASPITSNTSLLGPWCFPSPLPPGSPCRWTSFWLHFEGSSDE